MSFAVFSQPFKATGIGVVLLALLAIFWHAPLQAEHALAMYGEPKYPADFTYFNYANPDAPKGGTLALATSYAATDFDKLNPFTLRGNPAPGLLELVFETLAVYSLDETMTQYGLIADDIAIAPDARAVTFRINPRARFSNGAAITTADVKYSFETLTSPSASPRFRQYFAGVAAVSVIDERYIRFDFERSNRELAFTLGSLPVFSASWSRNENGQSIPFDEVVKQTPIASGPYVVDSADYGRGNVSYKRNPDYWAADLPVRRGTHNFERITYKLFRDYDLQVEAFKAGVFDIMVESKARNWCCVYKGVRFDKGEVTKRLFEHKNVPAMNGYVFNLRRARFQDVRVRKALSLAFDFYWVNNNIFYQEYRHPYSYFSTTDLAASGLPGEDELALLEPWRDQLDPAVFGPMVTFPSTEPPRSLRDNIIEGQRLLEEAGWVYRDGALRNAAGEAFVLEASLTEGIPLPRIETYLRNVALYGIEIRRRLTDPVTSRRDMQKFDFDLSHVVLRESRMPGGDIAAKFNSTDADVEGSENVIGVKSPAIDFLLEKLSTATTPAQLHAAARALDRVLMHGYYIVPERYSFEHRAAYDTRLAYPAVLPDYYAVYDWALAYWWERPDNGRENLGRNQTE
jgi:microcin C transport system substrate-binding protein